MSIGRSRLARALPLALACVMQHAAADNTPTEQSMRAAMVFNFLKFTDFPADAFADAQRLRLCIAVGDTQQTDALAALSGRKVAGRELVVVRLARQSDDCQVLYVDSRQRWNATEEQRALRRTLTISAYEGFVRDGGMIEIVLQDSGSRFDINLAESRRAGLRFSPQLLRLARYVHE